VAPLFRTASAAHAQLEQEIPSLATTEWRIRSPFNDTYQCIAWAASRTDRKWWPWDHPEFYWPPGFPKLQPGSLVPASYFVEVFDRQLGYQPCQSASFEIGYQKVAIYANGLGVTHMARQHFFGRGWLSKLGIEEDIFHLELKDVEGDIAPMAWQYGRVVQIMRRSWWTVLIKLCMFRCLLHAAKFWLYRMKHPSWAGR
jgi:hypothetical protein